VAAFAISLHERPERTAARLLRPTVLLFVAALHAALLLLALRWQARLEVRIEESLVFLAFPAHMQSAEEALPPPSVPRKESPPPTHDTQLVIVPPPTEPPPAEQKPAIIDWHAEAVITAKHQAQSAAAPQPRALDKQLGGMYVDVGPGFDPANTPEFGWDHARTHRVETIEGGGSMLWINDRCFVVLYGVIPFPMCGVGKIPVRGDLFDQMRDSQAQRPNANNTAP
jgi:choline dehydrogenase-like flavoprotein